MNGSKTTLDMKNSDPCECEPLQKFEDNSYVRSKKGLIAQSLVTAVVIIAVAGAGMPIGYSAVLLPQLSADKNDSLYVDEEMGSWIASIHSAATPVGSLLSGTLMDLVGRKLTLQLSCLPLIGGWISISFSNKHSYLLLGRILAGSAVGIMAAPGQVYLAEISDPSIRGVLTSIPFASYAFGILLVYILGSSTHWRLVAGLSIISPAISVLMYFFLPESPVWLVRKGKLEEARKACLWLKGGDVMQMKQEIQQLITRAEEEKSQMKESTSTWKVFHSSQFVKPLLIILIFQILQILTGLYLIVFYAVEMISYMGNEKLDENMAAILTAGVRFMFTVLASFLLAVVGRRKLGLGSAIGTAISALCLSLLLFGDCSSHSYVIAISLLAYVGASTLGLMVLPGVLIGEMFPARVRGLGGALSFTISNLMVFGTTKLFPLLKRHLGMEGLFLLFGITSLTLIVFIYLAIPETKGKTLNDIEDYFRKDNIFWVTRNRKKGKETPETGSNNNVKL